MNPSTTEPVAPTPANIRAACATVHDPEFGLSIEDLGLIYDASIDAEGGVVIAMTLTSPYCPAGDVIVGAVTAVVAAIAGVTTVDVRLVWEPAWTPDRVTLQGREYLGWTG
jgi:metal-sulfur cluster biosynthetic enzyme